MKQRKYFDCYAAVGPCSAPEKEFPHDIDSLYGDMAYARIHGAAFIHNAAKDVSFSLGNEEAIRLEKENSRLFSLAVVASSADYETGNKNYFYDLLDRGVRGFVTLNQSPFKGTLEPESMRKIVIPLLEHNKPLIVSGVNSEELYTKIDKLAYEYPNLPIIMQGTRWNTNRFFLEVMEKHDNLHYEIAQNHTNNIIEFTKKNFGIERVLYSSEWPLRSMGAIKSTVEYADITESEKNLVAHGNACRLFGVSPDELELYDEKDCQLDEIAKDADSGKPIHVPVIDAHSHIVGRDYGINNCIMLDADPASIVEKMDRLGVETTISAPWIGIAYDGIMGNEESIAAYNSHGGRIKAFSCCNVNYKEDLESVTKYHDKYPDIFVGIKPYPPYYKFSLTDEICREWFEYANEHNLIALIHADASVFSEETDILSERYPNVTFILAHSGTSYNIARKNAAVAKKHSNVVLDITYTTTGRGMVEFLVGEVGADKIIYGSDMPMRDASPQLGWICYAKIPVEDKKKILAENIKYIMEKRR